MTTAEYSRLSRLDVKDFASLRSMDQLTYAAKRDQIVDVTHNALRMATDDARHASPDQLEAVDANMLRQMAKVEFVQRMVLESDGDLVHNLAKADLANLATDDRFAGLLVDHEAMRIMVEQAEDARHPID